MLVTQSTADAAVVDEACRTESLSFYVVLLCGMFCRVTLVFQMEHVACDSHPPDSGVITVRLH